MKVKVGENVKVLAGKDKGKEGKVLRTLKSKNKVGVEGINIVKRHSKPQTNQDKGGIFEIEAPIHVSNVKVIENVKKAKDAKVKEVKKEEVKEEKKVAKKVPAKKTTSKKEEK